MIKQKCSILECNKLSSRRGFCNKHYRRFMKYGDSEISAYNRVDKGAPQEFVKEALSTNEEECLIWPYSKDSDGYGWDLLEEKMRSVHRFVCEKEHGPPLGERDQAAHSCGNPSCVNRKHIRWATRSENMIDKHEHLTMRTR